MNRIKFKPQDVLALAGLLALWLALFWPTLQDMESVWRNSDTYMHCYLVPLIALWLISEQPKLAASPGALLWWPVLLFTGAGLLWLVSFAADVALGSHLFAVVALQLLLIGWLGKTLAWQLKFPLFYLIFMLPFGEELHAPLQEITADISVYLLQLANVPVFREGLYLATPVGHFEVAEACSGLRFLIASLAIGCIFAHLYFKTWYRQWLFMVMLIAASILANGARAFLLIYLAEMSNMQLGFGDDHYIYGWLVFVVVLALMFWLGVRFSDKPQSRVANPDPLPAQPAVQRRYPALTVYLLVVSGGLFWQSRALPLITPPAQPATAQLPAGFTPATLNSWGVHFPASLASSQGINANQVEWYQASFAPRQRQGELINWSNQLYSSKRWTIAQAEQLAVPCGEAQLLSLKSTEGDSRTVLYWYQVGDWCSVNKAGVKLAQLWQVFRTPQALSSVTALSVAAEGAAARKLLLQSAALRDGVQPDGAQQ